MLSSNGGDFSNAYPISIEACDGMVWAAFFQLSGGAPNHRRGPNGVAADVVIDGQDFGTNARPAALACSGTELHVGFWSVSAGVIVWDLATNQVVDQLTSADGMSNSPVYYDAMATVGPASAPSIAVGYDTNNGDGGYAVYDVANRVPTVRGKDPCHHGTAHRRGRGFGPPASSGQSGGHGWPPGGPFPTPGSRSNSLDPSGLWPGWGAPPHAGTRLPCTGAPRRQRTVDWRRASRNPTWAEGQDAPGSGASGQGPGRFTAPKGWETVGGQGVGLLGPLPGTRDGATASNGLYDLDGLAEATNW
ncbi:MAG: hypothetical protein CM15mP18_2350 [Methanobacteriota archaeon]|nr:MAG: hypothetical protein CM15mP18_2350 [Euryarchaeota archaeon]